jgi:2-polyprenyl-6-methoxyphenol hydroxylase-like FAD-dependent oxidoreductase
VEIRYSARPSQIMQDEQGVTVTISNSETGATTTEHVDLLVGADGIHSAVRATVFGPPEDFLQPLGYVIAANLLDKPLTGLDTHDGVGFVEVGRAAFVFGYSDGTQSAFFNYRPNDIDAEFARPAAESLRAAFGPEPFGPLLTELLDQFEAAPDHLFDSTNQVKMPTWHQGRVVLVGDAAWCPTLYSGLGASSALAGASLLGDMLELHPTDLPGALAEWESTLRPHIDWFQEYCFTLRPFFMADTDEELAQRAEQMAELVDPAARDAFFATEEQVETARRKNVDIVPLSKVGAV